MIRNVLLLLFCGLTAFYTHAQAPDWRWAKSGGSAGTDNAFSIAAHRSGSTYVTGHFSNAAITFGSTTLTNAGDADIFVAKYDSSGNVLWGAGRRAARATTPALPLPRTAPATAT